MKKLLPLILLTLISALQAVSQVSYTVSYTTNAGNPGGLNTDLDDVVTGWNTLIGASISNNQWSANVPLPFSFNFYGNPVTAFKASANGLVTFNTTSNLLPNNNTNLPTSQLPDTSIACFWDAFTSAPPTNTNDFVAWKVWGTAPNRQLWIKWASYEIGSPSVSNASFGCVLEESTNNIYLVEGSFTVSVSTPATTVTAGIQLNASKAGQYGNQWRGRVANTNVTTDNNYITFAPYTPVAMSYVSSDAAKPITSGVAKGSTNEAILRLSIVTTGELTPLNLTQISFNNGITTSAGDISNAKVFYTGNSKGFQQLQQFGSSVNSPGASFNVSGSLALQKDTNYFWLVYNISPTAPVTNFVDGNCTQFVLDGVTQFPASVSPAGNRMITDGLSGTYTVGLAGNYPALSDAFKDINARGMSGNITLSVISDFDDTASAALTYTTGASYRIRIVPSADVLRNITGRINTSLVELNGSKSITIDGKGPSSGTGKYLRFLNTADTGSTFSFLNGARFDTLRNCIIEGKSTSSVRGVVHIGTSAGVTGNRDLVFSSNDIRDRSDSVGIPMFLVTSIGTPGLLNRDISFTNNNLFNFRRYGIYAGSVGNGDNWMISGNSFYYNSPSSFGSGDQVSILMQPGIDANNISILNNYIGGQQPLCGGAAWLNANPYNWVAMNVNAGLDAGTSIQGNVIQNINITATTASMAFVGIRSESGKTDIGTITPNIVGHATTANSISCALPLTFGIYAYLSSSGDVTVANNTVANILASNSGTASSLRGICFQAGAAVPYIISNKIYNLTAAAATTTATTNSLMGIGLNSGSETTPVIRNNTIYNLQNTAASANTLPAGIIIDNASTDGIVEGNVVYGISNISTGATAAVHGIYVVGGVKNMTFRNNMISLTNGTNTTAMIIRGISDNVSSNTCNYYNNSVFIGGSAASGTANSFAFERRSTETIVLRNNIFYNNRSGGTGVHAAIGNVSSTPTTAWGYNTSNYNLLVSAKSDQIVAWGSTFAAQNFTLYKNTGGSDKWSWSDTAANLPATSFFVNAANGDLRIDSTNALCWYAKGKGVAMTAVSNDIHGQARNTSIQAGTNDLGADAFSTTTTPPAMAISGNIMLGDSTSFAFAGRTMARIYWTIAGTLPSSVSGTYYSAPPIVGSGLTGKRFSNYFEFAQQNGLSFTYDLRLFYDSAVTGTVPDQLSIALARSTGANNWNYYNNTVTDSVNRSFFTSSLPASGFNARFTGTSINNPLPVKLIRFTGNRQQQDALLSWTSAAELNSLGYGIERSADGINYESVAMIGSRGAGSYTFNDKGVFSLKNSTVYYRLKMIDRDGRFEYSGRVAVNPAGTDEAKAIEFYPNPSNGNIFVNSAEGTTISISDLSGKIVFSATIPAGTRELSLPDNLGTGIYFITDVASGKTGKLIRQ